MKEPGGLGYSCCMAIASLARRALRRDVNCSRWLTELRQRADHRLIAFADSGLSGDKKMAIDACKAVEAQAAAEGREQLAEDYSKKRVGLLDG